MKKKPRRTEKVIILFTRDEKRDLRKEALRRDLPISEIVREAIEQKKEKTT